MRCIINISGENSNFAINFSKKTKNETDTTRNIDESLIQNRPATILDLNAAEQRITAKIDELDASTKLMMRNVAVFTDAVTSEIKSMMGLDVIKKDKGDIKIEKPSSEISKQTKQVSDDDVEGILLTDWGELDDFCVKLRNKEVKKAKVIKILLELIINF